VEKFLPGKSQVILKCDMSAWQKVYYQQVTDVGRVGLDNGLYLFLFFPFLLPTSPFKLNQMQFPPPPYTLILNISMSNVFVYSHYTLFVPLLVSFRNP
jgi:hypothetical protein